MDVGITTTAMSRREFLSSISATVGGCLVIIAAPSIVAAEQLSKAPVVGRRVDPYSVSMAGKRTLSTISDSYMLFELRRAIYDNSYWLWVRGTVYTGSNAVFGQGAKLVTPYGTVSDGMIYGTGDNWTVGSQRCTPAICIGMPTTTITVTYYGGTWIGDYSETVRIPAESIARSKIIGS